MTAEEVIEADNGVTISLYRDDTPLNPRTEYDNLGIMEFAHRRYNLGDCKAETDRCSSWAEYRKYLERREPRAVILPVYMYDHSGLAFNTTGFHACDSHGWDWGQLGFIFARHADILKTFGVKRVTAGIRARVEDLLRGELETYERYVDGDCWGYVITSADGDKLESCWGFLGKESCEQEARSAALNVVSPAAATA